MTPGPPLPFLVAEDLLLLALDPRTGKERRSLRPQVLGGAIVVDLGLLGLVRVEPGGFLRRRRVVVTGAPPPDPLLGPALARVAGRSQPPRELGRTLGEGARDAVLHRLVARGALRPEEVRTLGLRRTRWRAADTARRDAVGHHVVSMLLHGTPVDQRTAALAAVLVRTGLARVLLPLPPRTTHSQLRRYLDDRMHGLAPDLVDVMDACVDACGDGGGDGSGGDGGGGDGGGGGGD